jgi:hypothetical protein
MKGRTLIWRPNGECKRKRRWIAKNRYIKASNTNIIEGRAVKEKGKKRACTG